MNPNNIGGFPSMSNYGLQGQSAPSVLRNGSVGSTMPELSPNFNAETAPSRLNFYNQRTNMTPPSVMSNPTSATPVLSNNGETYNNVNDVRDQLRSHNITPVAINSVNSKSLSRSRSRSPSPVRSSDSVLRSTGDPTKSVTKNQVTPSGRVSEDLSFQRSPTRESSGSRCTNTRKSRDSRRSRRSPSPRSASISASPPPSYKTEDDFINRKELDDVLNPVEAEVRNPPARVRVSNNPLARALSKARRNDKLHNLAEAVSKIEKKGGIIVENELVRKSESKNNNNNLYDIYNNEADPMAGHEPGWETLYRWGGEATTGMFPIKAPFEGRVKQEANNTYLVTDDMEIAWNKWGDKGKAVIMLHGVPTNKGQYTSMQKRMSRFCRTLAIDMLGMGDSTKPLDYGIDANLPNGAQPWDWVYDTIYLRQVIEGVFPGERVTLIADDWGGGIAIHAAIELQDILDSVILIDPIALDGYPVNEIQAIGRASGLNDEQFMMAMGAIDSTIIQIEKTMVRDNNRFNQYVYKDFLHPYVETNYNTEGANSVTMGLKFDSLRVLADRAAVLAPYLLMPYDERRNPRGVDYNQINIPVMVLWGEDDNMMPATQLYRLMYVMVNSEVEIQYVPRAGHFAAVDQPDYISEQIMNFIIRKHGKDAVADIFLGFGDSGSGGRSVIWKGDEKELIRGLRKRYGKDVRSAADFLN